MGVGHKRFLRIDAKSLVDSWNFQLSALEAHGTLERFLESLNDTVGRF